MKKSILVFVVAAAGAWAQGQAQGQEPPRTDLVSYGSRSGAMACAWGMSTKDSSAYILDLSPDTGKNEWNFLQEEEGANVHIWEREFSLPFEWFDQAQFLYLSGMGAAVTLYVNDRYVGFTQADPGAPVEFELTGLLTPDALNRVRIEVTRRTLVSQLGAVYSDKTPKRVELRMQPKIRLRDYTVRTTLDPSYTQGFIEVAMLLKTQLLNTHEVTVYYDLYDPAGKLVSRAEREVTVGLKAEDTVRFTASVPGVRKWSAAEPNLYTLLFRVQREGRFMEYVARKVGFREIKVDGTQLLINGRAEQIVGGNVIASSFDYGIMQPSDLDTLKRLGFNALRPSGPMPEWFYARCDSLGFYVCDVAAMPSRRMPMGKSRGGDLSNDPAWKSLFLLRANNLYERAKNHPSVVMWDMGYSTNGYNMYRTYLFLKAKDDTRPVVFAGAWMEWNTDLFMPNLANFLDTYASGKEAVYNTIGAELSDDLGLAGRPYIPATIELDLGDLEAARPRLDWPAGAQGGFLDAPGVLQLLGKFKEE